MGASELALCFHFSEMRGEPHKSHDSSGFSDF